MASIRTWAIILIFTPRYIIDKYFKVPFQRSFFVHLSLNISIFYLSIDFSYYHSDPQGGARKAAGGATPNTVGTIVVPAAMEAGAPEVGQTGQDHTRWSTGGWWAGADDVGRLVESLRDSLDFPAGSYTLTRATGIRNVVVNPVPFPSVGRLRFASLSLYEYMAIEGPKSPVAIEMTCRHILAHITHLHDSTPHIPFGVYIAPRPLTPEPELADGNAGQQQQQHHLGPRTEGPGGFLAHLNGLDAQLPGAGHRVCSPAMIKQQREAVLLDMSSAITAGLLSQSPFI